MKKQLFPVFQACSGTSFWKKDARKNWKNCKNCFLRRSWGVYLVCEKVVFPVFPVWFSWESSFSSFSSLILLRKQFFQCFQFDSPEKKFFQFDPPEKADCPVFPVWFSWQSSFFSFSKFFSFLFFEFSFSWHYALCIRWCLLALCIQWFYRTKSTIWYPPSLKYYRYPLLKNQGFRGIRKIAAKPPKYQ